MLRILRAVRRGILIGTIGGVAVLSACADAAPTGPVRPKADALVSHDGGPPDETCRSGWVVVDGRWVCDNP
jgi:hypothetical protein